jgi:DNA-directed RNA polymerase specialized sigma24 family protein
MKLILIDHGRRKSAAKRAGNQRPIPLDVIADRRAVPAADAVALREAVDELMTFDARRGMIVTLRLQGHTLPEIADALGVSQSLVEKEFVLARAWLHRHLAAGDTQA